MPVTVIDTEPTPNPNARRYTLSAAVSDRPRSFRSPDDGKGDAQAGPLFAIPGVRVVLIGGDWVSVNKSEDASWPKLDPKIRAALSKLEPIASGPEAS
jgi:hypothetical protein